MLKMTFLISMTMFMATLFVLGQSSKQTHTVEAEIRKLDQAEAEAILKNDADAAAKFYADDITVNNPRNTITKGKQELLTLIKSGAIHYSSFVREVESFALHGDTAFVLGSETVKPIGNSPGAGQTIRRRFTDVWVKRGGKWLLTVRHANIICQ